MACGDAYLKTFAVTADGKTMDDPYVGLASVGDYEAWRATAMRMWELMHRNFIVLGEAEKKRVDEGKLLWEDSAWNRLVGAAGSPDGTLFQRLLKFHGAIWQSFDDWPEITWESDITELRNLIRDTACTWEEIDTAIVAIDPTLAPKVPGGETPGPEKKGGGKFDLGDWINNVTAIGLLAIIAYAAYKLVSTEARDEGQE